MCIVIDSCAFSSIFNREAKDHCEFLPILNWIVKDKGKMVYGGSKYKKELSKIPKYLRFVGQLKRAGKVIEINGSAVDKHQSDLEAKCRHRDFDDAHIVAIVIESGCKLICTNERRAIPFFKNNDFYPKGVKKPKLYTSSNNCGLLEKKKLYAKICMPVCKRSIELSKLFDL